MALSQAATFVIEIPVDKPLEKGKSVLMDGRIRLRDEIAEIINVIPPRATIRHDDKPENAAWFGRTSAAIQKWNPEKGVLAREHIDLFLSRGHAYATGQGLTKLLALLHEAKTGLEWEAVGNDGVRGEEGGCE